MTLIATLLATAAGKWIVAALGVVVALVGAWLNGRLSGAKAERTKQAVDQLDAIKDKKAKDDEVNSLGPADLDSRFKRWMHDDR